MPSMEEHVYRARSGPEELADVIVGNISIWRNPRSALREVLENFVKSYIPSEEDMAALGLAMQGSVMGDRAAIDKIIALGGLKKLDELSRLARMTAQGYTRGYWRGGRNVADGPYYTPDKVMAERFGARHGQGADVREYALRLGKQLDFNTRYAAEDLADLSRELAKENPKAAAELLQLPADWGGGIPGSMLYQVLDRSSGNAHALLRRAGYDTINAGKEVVILHKRGLVRDALRAKFDPARVDDPDPFAGMFLLGGGEE